ncbi:fimbrial protein, partial [Escherichia coli]|uniref:fimbrial protein n=1 Tax=Escherichia coli TaxID=562 RepID=UPI001F0F495E
HHAFSSGAGRTSDGNGSHASTLKSPSYTKSVSWQHYRTADRNRSHWSTSKTPSYTKSVSWQHHLPDEYIALEFKGMSGAGAIEVDKNLTFRIRGLNNIHVLDCFVNVDLEPADGVVDFGKINSRTIKNTSVSETFSVVMTKDPGAACTEQFNILGSFFTTDILSDYSHLDIGNGLLLKIFHNDGTATEFNRFSQFASFSSSSAPSVTAPFRAELSANPAETVVEGPFSKDVILKITYN